MTILNRAKVVKDALPLRITRPGSEWRICDSSMERAVDDLLHVLRDGAAAGEMLWYKKDEKKWVFRTDAGHVVKVFHLNTLSLRLKYRRYARDEAANLVWAASKGVHVPKALAAGAMRNRAGLVSRAALVMSELVGLRTVTELIQDVDGEPGRIATVLRATIPAFERLYQCGCNHIDLNAGNILLDPHDLEAMPAVIDFKYAMFHPQPSLELLILGAGRFASNCAHLVSGDVLHNWFEQLLDRLAVHDEGQRTWCRQRFEYYRHAKLSRKDRRRAKPYPVAVS